MHKSRSSSLRRTAAVSVALLSDPDAEKNARTPLWHAPTLGSRIRITVGTAEQAWQLVDEFDDVATEFRGPTVEQVVRRPFREAACSRQVRSTYRCAFTALNMRNGCGIHDRSHPAFLDDHRNRVFKGAKP